MSDLPALRTHAQLEAIVERGLSTFVDVGQALAKLGPREFADVARRHGISPEELARLARIEAPA